MRVILLFEKIFNYIVVPGVRQDKIKNIICNKNFFVGICLSRSKVVLNVVLFICLPSFFGAGTFPPLIYPNISKDILFVNSPRHFFLFQPGASFAAAAAHSNGHKSANPVAAVGTPFAPAIRRGKCRTCPGRLRTN